MSKKPSLKYRLQIQLAWLQELIQNHRGAVHTVVLLGIVTLIFAYKATASSDLASKINANVASGIAFACIGIANVLFIICLFWRAINPEKQLDQIDRVALWILKLLAIVVVPAAIMFDKFIVTHSMINWAAATTFLVNVVLLYLADYCVRTPYNKRPTF